MQMSTATIEPARADDLAPIVDLLAASGLPTAGIGDILADTLTARQGGRIVGCAALERYPPFALLRSVAVAAPYRGQGLGLRLSRAALDLASSLSISHVYLLTESASDFFPRIGFEPIDRSQIPAPVLAAEEFTTLCPDSALAMVAVPAGS